MGKAAAPEMLWASTACTASSDTPLLLRRRRFITQSGCHPSKYSMPEWNAMQCNIMHWCRAGLYTWT